MSRQVLGAPITKGAPSALSRVSVAHGRSYMLTVIGLHGCLESLQAVVHLSAAGNIDFRAGGPYHYHAAATMLLLEVADILAHLLHQLPAGGLRVFHPRAIQGFHVIGVIYALHGHYLLQLLLYGIDVAVTQHLGVHGALESVIGQDVPRTQLYIVERRHRYNLRHGLVLCLRALAHAYFRHLGDRTYGLAQPLANHQHSRDKRGTHGTQAYAQDAQLAF